MLELNKLRVWEFVSPNLEKEKYFRYNCFQKKWLKITKDKRRTINYLQTWADKTAITGEDMIVHIISTLENSTNPDIYLELIEAVSVISDRNLNGLSKEDIAEAISISEDLFQQSLVEESLFDYI